MAAPKPAGANENRGLSNSALMNLGALINYIGVETEFLIETRQHCEELVREYDAKAKKGGA